VNWIAGSKKTEKYMRLRFVVVDDDDNDDNNGQMTAVTVQGRAVPKSVNCPPVKREPLF